ncbi:MAG: UMP kinase [Deltaproteobacteria bacterium]|nr:UMP kinase [Deltaproteobacteria bacterium]
MSVSRPQYRRILLKLSGEALMGGTSYGIDPEMLNAVANEIHEVHSLGVDVALVVGGGNIFRGLRASEYGMRRVLADHMGMAATVINAIAMAEAIRRTGSEPRVMSALEMNKVVEPYICARALRHLEKGRVLLLAGGTGCPYFSTDTAAAVRALEIGAEVLLKATKVDGVYSADPVKNASASFYTNLTYREILERNLRALDLTAVVLAMEQGLPVIVFNFLTRGNIRKVITGEKVGTLISGG